MKILTFSFIALLALFCQPSHAQTQFQSQTQTFGPLSPSFDSDTDITLDPLTFNQFDTSLGDLVSIQVITGLSIDAGEIIIDNDGVNPSDVTVELGADVDFTPNGVQFLDTGFNTIGQGVQASTSQTFLAVGSNDSDPVNQFDNDSGPDNRTHVGTQDSNTDSGFIHSTFWGAYTGPGTFTVDYSASNILNILGSGGVSGSFVPSIADGSVEVVYGYTPVPEPNSAILLMVGGMFVLLRRNRRGPFAGR